MAEIGVTEVDATRQALVAALVQETLKTKSILLPTVTDYSRFAVPGAKSVAIPRRDQFAAADKAENTDLLLQEITFVSEIITLDKHKAIYCELERIAAIQANVDVRGEIIEEMALELALQIDKDLIVELKDISSAAPDHWLDYAAAGGPIAQADILEARRLLSVQKVPMNDRYLVISPTQEKAMLLISDFVRADQYGSSEGLRNGELGRIYGFTVLVHTELDAVDSLIYHKSHVGFAMQAGAEFETDKNLKAVADQFLLHQIYGCETLDVTATGGRRGVYFDGAGA